MCGRYTLAVEREQLKLRFGLETTGVELRPRYNVAPGQEMPVVVAKDGRDLKLMRWGLVSSWARDETVGYKMINARSETVHQKPSFRTPFRERRCLVPADGYYEWRKTPGLKRKTPVRFILTDGRLFGFAGLWDVWRDPDGHERVTYTILTTGANDLSRPIHHRMPVILRQQDEEVWLDPDVKEPSELLPLLMPYPSEAMNAYEVSTVVNSPSHDSPECIAPVGG